jgi:NitT/TauT family transport system ATP-binding protein
MLVGIEAPDVGSITVHPSPPDLKVSYVPQDYRSALFPWLTLEQNIALAMVGNFRSAPPREIVAKFCSLAGRFRFRPPLTRYPYQLSGGEQQLFLLILAISQDSHLLVLDEPFAAVDFGRRQLVLAELLSVLNIRRHTFVGVTHDYSEAVLLADVIWIIDTDTATIREKVPISLSWPRDFSVTRSSEFLALTRRVIDATL